MTKRRITKEIKAELDRLKSAARDKRLRWQDVVLAARDKSSPLHAYFDFNREAAMEHYLRAQAEELIASYTVVVMTDSGEKVRTRAFVSISTDRQNGGGYRSILDVLSDEDLKQQMLLDALSDLAAFKERYKELKELSAIFEAIKKVEKTNARRTPQAARRRPARASDSSRSLRL
jgi:hypothetical protein